VEKTPPTYPEVVEFMRAIARNLATEGPADTFTRLVERGAFKIKEQRKFLKWWSGHNEPNHQATTAMLKAAGMLVGMERGRPPYLLEQLRDVIRLRDEVPAADRLRVAEEVRAVAVELVALAGDLERLAKSGSPQ